MEYRESGKPKPPDGMEVKEFRRRGLLELAGSKQPPGLIGYDDQNEPVGWVSLGPRSDYIRLKRSRVMKAVDDKPVWSVICFVVPSPHRGQGIAAEMLRHAISYARSLGVETLEAYPTDKIERSQPQWLWHGVKSMFDQAGFVEVARNKPERVIVRLDLS